VVTRDRGRFGIVSLSLASLADEKMMLRGKEVSAKRGDREPRSIVVALKKLAKETRAFDIQTFSTPRR